MSVQNLQIIFDNPTAIFIPGDIITGRVLIVISNAVKIKKIKLTFKGEANVLWKEHHNIIPRKNSKHNITNRRHSLININTKTERYTAKEEYFKHKIILAGGEGKLLLKEGEHVYPFSVSLPDHLPSSFEDEYGHIQYVAKAVIKIPWDMKKGKEITFEVISSLNLNDEPSLTEPKIHEKEKYYCCCCCKSGPMTMIVYVPYIGYVPGQSVPVTIELDNNSNVDVDSIKIKLERILKFKARFPSSKIMSKPFMIVNLCMDGVEKHSSKTRTVQLKIPNSLIIPNLKHCGIITDLYFLNVEACVNGGYINEVISINITLGDVPLNIADNIIHSDYSYQLSNQIHLPNEPLPKMSLSPLSFIESMPVPGYAQLLASHQQQNSSSSIEKSTNSENMMISTKKNSIYIQLSAYPDPLTPYHFSDPKTAHFQLSSINNEQIMFNS